MEKELHSFARNGAYWCRIYNSNDDNNFDNDDDYDNIINDDDTNDLQLRQQNAKNNAKHPKWTKHLATLLQGTKDKKNSPLSLLCGFESTIIKYIYELLYESWQHDHVTLTQRAKHIGRREIIITTTTTTTHQDDDEDGDTLQLEPDQDYAMLDSGPSPIEHVLCGRNYDESVGKILGCKISDRPEIAFSICGKIDQFPQYSNININMMPFILGDKKSLPTNIQPYYDACIGKCPVQQSEIGKVCYLTISEGYISNQQTQRRQRLHIEAPNISLKNYSCSFNAALVDFGWGGGFAYTEDELHGGIYFASNVSNTSAVWDALVDKNAADELGDIEHLRPFLGGDNVETILQANQLCWMTDRTPHEALPQPKEGYRQFFRLVTSEITGWWEDHSTPNPKVTVPKDVLILKGNKFDLIKRKRK